MNNVTRFSKVVFGTDIKSEDALYPMFHALCIQELLRHAQVLRNSTTDNVLKQQDFVDMWIALSKCHHLKQ